MLNAFASVGVKSFDVTLTNVAGEKVNGRFRSREHLEKLRRTIGRILQEAEINQQNVIVRPRSQTVTLVQLDDLDEVQVELIVAHAFIVTRTSPGNYQVWIAVQGVTQDFARRLRLGTGADPAASGATRIAGSLNFKSNYAPIFPLIEITQVCAGKVACTTELEAGGFTVKHEYPPPITRQCETKKWPSYEQCLAAAPRTNRGGRADRSRADFTWCMIAIDWGRGVDETAERLMGLSTKAQENGRMYALRTAQNAAVATSSRRIYRFSDPPAKQKRKTQVLAGD
jgi:hypothetical protein